MKTMKRERESMRESEEVREKTRVRMILNRSPCFYTGVNRIGSVRPVWFTPKTWMPTVWSRIGSLGQSDGLCCSLWPRIRLSLGLGLKPVHFLCFTYFVLFSYHCLIITPLPCLECLKKILKNSVKTAWFFLWCFCPKKLQKIYCFFVFDLWILCWKNLWKWTWFFDLNSWYMFVIGDEGVYDELTTVWVCFLLHKNEYD
jgi:hypothetical protein